MKKTLSINLSGLVFTIDEDAYAVLKNYLDDIARYFAKEIGKEEIIADIESRFAEEFNQKRSAAKQVITIEDVNAIIATMGRVEDFSEEGTREAGQKESPRDTTNVAPASRRLYRDTDNAIIGGVASGIGNYFSVDPVFIRILFVIFTFAGGFAIPLYIILWIITPKAETPLQKAEMKGEPLTLKNIEEQVKKVVDEGKKKLEDLDKKNFGQRLGGFFREIGTRLQVVFGKLFRGLGSIIGFFLSLAAFLGIVALGVAAGIAFVHRNNPNLGIQIHNYLPTPEYFLSVIFITGIILFPLLALFLLGVRLFKKRPTFSTTVVSVLLVFWALCLMGGGAMITKIVPAVKQMRVEAEQNNSERKTVNYDLANFDRVILQGQSRVHIKKGDNYSVQITAKEWEFNEMRVEKNGTALSIEPRDHFSFCLFCTHSRAEIAITLPDLKEIQAYGDVEVVADEWKTDSLKLSLMGASRFEGKVEVQDLFLEEHGASKVHLSGTSKRAEFDVHGASQIEAFDLSIDALFIDMQGASRAKVTVNHNIEGELSGASEMRYRGTPLVNALEVRGAAGVRSETETVPLQNSVTSTEESVQ